MKPILYTLCITLCSFFVLAQKTYTMPSPLSNDDYLNKTIIIKVKPQYATLCSSTKINHTLFNTMANTIGVINLNKKFPNDKSPEKEYNSSGQKYVDLSLIYELNYTSDLYIEKAISKLLASGILVYAEPHFVPKVCYSPNDPLANSTDQYHLQTIQAFNAWNINKGDSAIVIGITDTGTDFTHTDLFNNTKRNYADPIDGLDNDGDTYIDNYYGWDLGENDNNPDHTVNAHGVHVSGIAGAAADNNFGGAGVGFNCKLLPIKIANAFGALTQAYEGIKYAADHGCTSINCSWGGGGASQFGQDIIDYATINKNCLIVAAAGNNGVDGDFFPAAYNYVIAVANTDNTDAKSASSNYGYFVDVCAPGNAINSTWAGNSYIYNSGTSMSSPVVAGAAGIVKKQFPSYTGLQIAERLKVTADNIYPLNGAYTNKLGAGRINLFRALTDPASPSVVMSNRQVIDHNDNVFISGDTLFITGLFTNYLNPTSALTVSVSPLSLLSTIVDNTTTLGVINTLASANNNSDPFRFKLSGSIATNQGIDFEVIMTDGTYQAKQYFTVYLNVDYINITINDINTTATSRAKIGYNQDSQVQGLGFSYNNIDMLYEAGFLMGIDSAKVSDCVRGTSGNIADTDFSSVIKIATQYPAIKSDFDTKAKLNDNTAFTPLNVEVEQNTYAWATTPNEQFVIWEYVITNTSATNTLTNFYAGIFTDWDIDGGTYTQNRSAFDATTNMGYSFYTGANGKYAGVKLLTSSAPANFNAIDNISGGAGGLDLTNGFDTKEKYKALSIPRLAAGVSGSGADIMNVMSAGPYTILPNQTITVAFALLAGDSLTHLKAGANQAQIKYNGIPTTSINNITQPDFSFAIYPNPNKGIFNITQSQNDFSSIEIYSSKGDLILNQAFTTSTSSIDMTRYAKGLYLVKLVGANRTVIKKLVLE